MADDDLQSRITRNVRVLMALRGIHEQRVLADQMGLQPHDISRRMKGRWQIGDLDRLADALGVGTEMIVAREISAVVTAVGATGTDSAISPGRQSRISAEISWLMPRSMPSVGIADSENGENVTQPVDLDAYRARKHAKPINSALQAARVG